MNKSTIIFWSIVMIAAVTIFVRYLTNKPILVNGDKARDIAGQTTSGDIINLRQYEGHYILLEFWGSWCAPCRKQNKTIRQIGEKYADRHFKHNAGFKLVFFALEDDMGSWLKGIDKDSLNDFIHMVDTNRMEAEAALQYGIKSIPASFLIDPNFTIIGVNPDEKTITDILEANLAR